MTAAATVFVVDDDEAVRQSLVRLIESVGLPAEAYGGADAFLSRCQPERPGCLILDLCMPGTSGLELQERLIGNGISIPIIAISGHADVEKAVRAMKNGALDFIKKPYKAQVLLDAIRKALEIDAGRRRQEAGRSDVAVRLATLTPREREVLDLLAAGNAAKEIALTLKLSRKTVDLHRRRAMAKLGVNSLADLLRVSQISRPDPLAVAPPLPNPPQHHS
ncbi:MAG TPA: response regulator [Phycisphaerae bacterium]|nr:response regulator [Phycisphaerae bacterium]